MFERKLDLDVVFTPATGVDADAAVAAATAWLRSQPGEPLVLMPAKKSYQNNPTLAHGTAGMAMEAPDTVWRSGWRGGPVLAPWPSERVLGALSDQLASQITKICVIEWSEHGYRRSWLEANHAVNLFTGEVLEAGTSSLLDPVVRVAMEELSRRVNHNNALISGYEKSLAVRYLQALHRAGYQLVPDDLCAWALASGFTEAEVRNLRDYSSRVKAGRTFRLPETAGPGSGAIAEWERAARSAGS